MNLTDRYIVSKDAAAREVGGEMVILDLDSGRYFGLDPVGARIWKLLEEGEHDVAAIIDRIEAEFDAPRATIEADLRALLSELVAEGLAVKTGE